MTHAPTGTTNPRPDAGVPPPRIAVYAAAADHAIRQRAARLATDLKLPISPGPQGPFDILLVVDRDRLELRQTESEAPGPVYADFIGDRVRTIKPTAKDLNQPIARAVGMDRHQPTVVDATVGLGRDAFLLAWLGCRVIAVERSPIVAAVLADGLQRARSVPALETVITQRLDLIVGDAREILPTLADRHLPDVIYLDPMFTPKSKLSPLAKKEMRLFRILLGDDPDAAQLFEAAIQTARRRVVVKRHPHAEPLAPNPTMSIEGKITRYDVYCHTQQAS